MAKFNILFAILLTCMLSGWAVTDAANDYMSEDNKFIKTGGVYFWLTKLGVILCHMLMGFVLFKSYQTISEG